MRRTADEASLVAFCGFHAKDVFGEKERGKRGQTERPKLGLVSLDGGGKHWVRASTLLYVSLSFHEILAMSKRKPAF